MQADEIPGDEDAEAPYAQQVKFMRQRKSVLELIDNDAHDNPLVEEQEKIKRARLEPKAEKKKNKNNK